MALTVLVDGDLASVADVNQYRNLLTGSMTDQAVYLKYLPGSGTTPTLKLDGDGNGALIKGLKTDHSTEAFSVTSAGAASFASTVTAGGKYIVSAAGAGDPDLLRFAPTDAEKALAIYYDHTNDALGFYNYTNSTTMGRWESDGDLFVGKNLAIVGTLTGVTSLTMSGALSGATTGAFSSTLSAASFQGPSGVAASFRVYDNAVGTLRNIRIFIGTTDPSTYTTVNEGDIWIKA